MCYKYCVFVSERETEYFCTYARAQTLDIFSHV